MKKINNKGFAISTIIYGTLIMAVMIVMILLATMSFTSKTSKDMAKDVESKLNATMNEEAEDPSTGGKDDLDIDITAPSITELEKPHVTVNVPTNYTGNLTISFCQSYDTYLNHSTNVCAKTWSNITPTNGTYSLEVPITKSGEGSYYFRVTSFEDDNYLATIVQKSFNIHPTSNPNVIRLLNDDPDYQGTYEFTPGMTWAQFIASTYNTNSATVTQFTESSGYAYFSPQDSRVYTILPGGTAITSSTTITAGVYYVYDNNCCFKGDTRIMTSLDGKTKAIKDIDIGDTVVIQNTKTGERRLTRALKVANEHKPTTDLATVKFENGKQLQYNPYHPLWTTKGYRTLDRYKDYKKLEVGDVVLLNDGSKSKVTKIIIDSIPKADNLITYNILLAGVNDYYLEDEWGYFANNILAHHGILKYYDEDEYRKKHAPDCVNKKLYQDFNFDKASDEEIVDFIVDLFKKNQDAYNEYFKYYLSAREYQRFVKLYSRIKAKIANNNSFSSTQTSKFTGLNNN